MDQAAFESPIERQVGKGHVHNIVAAVRSGGGSTDLAVAARGGCSRRCRADAGNRLSREFGLHLPQSKASLCQLIDHSAIRPIQILPTLSGCV